jgi:hypothetical protein
VLPSRAWRTNTTASAIDATARIAFVLVTPERRRPASITATMSTTSSGIVGRRNRK